MAWLNQIRLLAGDPVRLVQWFMLCRHAGILLASVVIARSLPIEQVGVFEMLMLSGYLVTFFWSEALLKGYLARPKAQSDKSSVSSFVWLYFIAGLISLGLLVAMATFLIPLFTGRSSLEGLGLFAGYQALVIVIWIAPFIGLFTLRQLHFISVFVCIGPALACWAGYALTHNLEGILSGLICYAAIGMALTMRHVTWINLKAIQRLMLIMWPVTWPLVMYALSAGLARSFDSWLVSRQFDEASFAIFRYGAREFPVVIALAGGLSTIMIPKLLGNVALEELRARSTRLMHLCYPAVAVIMLCSPFLFPLFFGPSFRPSAFIFNIYLLLTLTQLIFPQSIMTARGDTRLLWYISMAELVVNVLASLALLSYFGLEGIAMGTLIAFAFEKVVLLFFIYRRYAIRPSAIFKLHVWLAYAAVLVLAFNAAKWIAGV